MKTSALFLAMLSIALSPSLAPAQVVVYETYRPVVAPAVTYVESPVVYQSYRPIDSASTFTNYHPDYAPVAGYAAPVVTTYRPALGYAAPAVAYRAGYSPVVAYSPVVSYSPVVAYSPVAYSPVVTTYAYRPVYVRPRVYVPGQPVRNFFRGW
ncbi:MAG TPA: hypothetical protein VND64_06980 [Pirellulales bacterium]|nr:hypothetical protein [Pirellulales bacterium]